MIKSILQYPKRIQAFYHSSMGDYYFRSFQRQKLAAEKKARKAGNIGYWCNGEYYKLDSCPHEIELVESKKNGQAYLAEMNAIRSDKVKEDKEFTELLNVEINRARIIDLKSQLDAREAKDKYKVSDKLNELEVIPSGLTMTMKLRSSTEPNVLTRTPNEWNKESNDLLKQDLADIEDKENE